MPVYVSGTVFVMLWVVAEKIRKFLIHLDLEQIQGASSSSKPLPFASHDECIPLE